MRRRHAVVLTGLFVLLGIAIALGGAAVSQAGPRVIDPFTVTASPSPAQLGRHVAYTVAFTNNGHTVNQATLTSTATAGATFADYTTSRGTCAADPNNPASVTCTYGHLEAGAQVTTTLRFNTPPPASGATSMALDTALVINESGGDPGSTSIFHPTPNPTTVGLAPQNPDVINDVFGTAGGTAATDPVTATNTTSTALTTPATGAFETIGLSEGPAIPGTCGPGTTQRLGTTTIDAPGTFSTTLLQVVYNMRAASVPGSINQIKGCHNGFTLPLTGCPAPIPPQGCLQSRTPVVNENGVLVYRLTMLAPTNGHWGGGN